MPPKAEVHMDCGSVPTGLDSWRGSYSELTLTHQTNLTAPMVKEVLDDARSAVGKTFQGFKGGNFTMDLYSAVWADEYGTANMRIPIAIKHTDSKVTIITFLLPSEYR